MDRDETVEAVVRALRKANWEGEVLGQTVAIRLGLSESDIDALRLLVDTGAETAGRLAELLGLTTGAVTRVLDRLEQAGYVRRKVDPTDRRRVVVEPVTERLGQVEPILEGASAVTARELENYSPEQRELISDFLQRVWVATQAETERVRGPRAGFPALPPLPPLAPLPGLPGRPGLPRRPSSPTGPAAGNVDRDDETVADGEHAAPLGALTRAELIFRGGTPELTLRAESGIRTDAGAPALYRARFEGSMPVVRVRDGQVRIHYKGFFAWRGRKATMTLNAGLPWALEIRGGAPRMTADLAALDLRKLSIVGGAAKLDLTLGPPHGHVSVSVVGGAGELRLRRPAGVPVHLSVTGGLGKVDLDGQQHVAHGGVVTLITPGPDAPDRYVVDVVGGLGKVIVR